jgi:long-subunit acyl-CoA synthetase (AMP-forming)
VCFQPTASCVSRDVLRNSAFDVFFFFLQHPLISTFCFRYKLQNGKFVVPQVVENAVMRSPYILQAFAYGLDRPHNVALIVPDAAALKAHYGTQLLPFPVFTHVRVIDWKGTAGDLLKEKAREIREFLQSEVESNQDSTSTVKSYEKVLAWFVEICRFCLFCQTKNAPARSRPLQ